MGALNALLFVLWSILVVVATEILVDGPPGNDVSAQTAAMQAVCAKETVLFCSDVGHTTSSNSIRKCLVEYENVLSESCADFIRSMSVGACNKDVHEFCSHIQTNEGLDQCIQSHASELSPQCQWNVLRRNNRHTREKETERRYVRFSKAVTGLCGVYLLVPFVFAVWAALQIYTLNRKQAQFRQNSQRIAYTSSEQEKSKVMWSIEFHDVSFGSIAKTTPSWPLAASKNSPSKIALQKVSGWIRGGEMAAILGPPGSGKGSLLRVLSGRATRGQLTGMRALNERAAYPRVYDRVMRRQGFVPAGAARSDLLTPGLTLWQWLLHAALLRLPHSADCNEIMHRAWEVLLFMDLELVADTVLTEEEHRHNSRQLTELQVKCVQVAVSLLSRPEALFLEQPLSSLSGAESVKFLRLLKKICSEYATAVVFTVDQPTKQEYALVDSVLVLSPTGQMLYSGSSAAAATFFSTLAGATELAEFSLPDSDISSPSDIVFDILHQCEASPISSPDGSSSQNSSSSPYDLLPDADAEREELLSATDPHFVQVHMVDGDVEMQDLSEDSGKISHQRAVSRLQRAMTFIHQCFVVSDEYFNLQDRRALLVSEKRPSAQTAKNQVPFQPSSRKNGTESEIEWDAAPAEPIQMRRKAATVTPLTQVWVLLSHRSQVWSHDLNTIVLLSFQVFVAPLIICIAVGEVAQTELERPKQAAGILGWISLNALLLQCFLIVPSCFAERSVLDVQSGANSVNEWAHTLSTAVSDVVVAIVACTVTLSFAYVVHPLNADTAHVAFAFVCFIVGTCAWQAFIRLTAELTGGKRATIGVVALALCFGAYVNGVVTEAPRLPHYLSFTPYLSVSSVLSRALVASDLHCCYLSTTCATLAKEAARETVEGTVTYESYVCPVSVQFTGDGTDEGNLGRWYLQMIGLDQDRPHILLFVLFWVNVIFRVATNFIIQRRNKSNLKFAAL